ncbi:MAG: hypothetical protein ABIP51_03790 [Bacteroidia bacterium]
MKIKLSKRELLILIGFVIFFFVVAMVWFIQNRKKLYKEWLNIQSEIRALRYKIRNYTIEELRQKRRAFIALTLLKLTSLIIFFLIAQYVHWQFSLNPIASCVCTYTSIVALYYMTMYLISNKIYSLTEFLEIVFNGLTKIFLKTMKVELLDVHALNLQIENKNMKALIIKEQLKNINREFLLRKK